MDSSFEAFYSSSSSDDSFVEENIRKKKCYQTRIDDNYYDDDEFKRRFRLTKRTFNYLSSLIQSEGNHCDNRGLPLSVKQQLMLTLRFYATGNYQLVTGDLIGVSQSTACIAINKISRAIASLSKRFIKMPSSSVERIKIISDFYALKRIPKCIGCIDGCHIPIQSPGGDNAEIFRNRKNYFSINVQAICDANCMFQDIVVRWHGSAHDQTILNFSAIKRRFDDGEFEDSILIGDGGYGCKRYLITPYRNPTTQQQITFNKALCSTRVCIEMTFGMWKRRFPVLTKASQMKLSNYLTVIVATAVVYNIAKIYNEADDFDIDESDALNNFEPVSPTPPSSSEYVADTTVRDLICSRF